MWRGAAVLYKRISELEAELNSGKWSKSNRRSGTRKVILQDQPVESMRPGTAAGGLIQPCSANASHFRPGTADLAEGTRGTSYDAGGVSSRAERAQRMVGAQVLRVGANGGEDEEFEQAFR